ncbi:TNF receptor-associated protein 1, mitochondrial [Sparganum proliferum]
MFKRNRDRLAFDLEIELSEYLPFLLSEAKKNPKNLSKSLSDLGICLKHGIVTETDQSTREDVARVLYYESSVLSAGDPTSFDARRRTQHLFPIGAESSSG